MRHGLALLGDLPLGAVVPGNQLSDGALGDGIERFNRRRGLPPGRRVDPGSPAAVRLAKELGIAFADKLPDAARPEGPHAADRHGGGPRPLADKQKGKVTGDRPGAAYWGEYGSEPVVGALDDEDFRRRIVQITGVPIPEETTNEQIKQDRLRLEWVPYYGALKEAGIGPVARFALMTIFAWEGGTKYDKRDGGAAAGITNNELPKYAEQAGIGSNAQTQSLTNRQRAEFYKAYFNARQRGSFERIGGLQALDDIGDQQIAAAIANPFVRWGQPAFEPVIQTSIYETLTHFPILAASLTESRRDNDDPDRPAHKEANINPDGKLGPDTLKALKLVATSEEGKRYLLNKIADNLIAYHRKVNGPLDEDDWDFKRYNYFRFQ